MHNGYRSLLTESNPVVENGCKRPVIRMRSWGMREFRSTRNIALVRILSLLPSATEILFDLGLGDQVVGVTFECDFPPEAREGDPVGGPVAMRLGVGGSWSSVERTRWG